MTDVGATRPTVVLVAYTFPPRGGVGGLRPARLARSLARRGWRVFVITADPAEYPPPATRDEARVVEADVQVITVRSRGLLQAARNALGRRPFDAPTSSGAPPAVRSTPVRSRAWLRLRSLLLFPDDHVGFIAPAVAAAQKLCARPGSVLVTTSPPESCLLVGSRLKRRQPIPWVADFRDPWGFSHLRPRSPLDVLHRRLEARTLRHADAIVTVTEGWGRRFRALYPRVPCRVIRNGHALDRVSGRGPGTFRILYTGKLDLVEQDPTPLLEGLRAWLARSPPPEAEVLFHLYGAGAERAEAALRASGLPIECGGPLGQRASEEAQTGAAVLIAFSWRRDPACVPAKLYDYLASRRRILVLGSARAEMAQLVREAGVGASAETGPEVEAVLGRFYAEWRGGAWEPAGAMRAAEEFAFERRADEYEALLRELTSPRGAQA